MLGFSSIFLPVVAVFFSYTLWVNVCLNTDDNWKNLYRILIKCEHQQLACARDLEPHLCRSPHDQAVATFHHRSSLIFS